VPEASLDPQALLLGAVAGVTRLQRVLVRLHHPAPVCESHCFKETVSRDSEFFRLLIFPTGLPLQLYKQ
jgi:hypothetical protein